MPPFERIITHDDLDGTVSAALVSLAEGIDRFFFTGPVAVFDGSTQVTERDVVCDLPCPIRVGMWFDHHPGNLADVRLRGVDPGSVPGRFAPARSCARVVFDHYRERTPFPPFIEETVARTDRIDSFDYATMAEWREPLPERLIADSITAIASAGGLYPYLERLIRLIRERPMAATLEDEEVRRAVEAYRQLEERSLKLMREDSSFLPTDPGHEVVVVDLTRHNRKPEVVRAAAFILHPEALAVLLVQNAFRAGKKTNDLSFSMSLSFLMNKRPHRKDIGEIMRTLNIGDGHAGAGAGRMSCQSKAEMVRLKARTVERMVEMFQAEN